MTRNMRLHARCVGLALAVGLVLALSGAASAGPHDATYCGFNDHIFWFVQASDTHVGMRGSNDTTRLQWLVTTARATIQPAFIVVTGDLTDSTNGNLFGIPNGPYQSEWDSYKSILSAAGVTAGNYYDLPGNHDAYSDKYFTYYLANSVQGRATHSTQVSWTRSFDWGTYHFLGVNTAGNTGASFSFSFPYGDPAGLDDTELSFITEDLTNHASNNLTFVFGHHPVTDTGVSSDTWLLYGQTEFIHGLDVYGSSAYEYGHTHEYSDTMFAGNSYTGSMAGGGIRYLNIASLGKTSSNNYAVVAVDCDGVSAVPATYNTWPVVLITAPVSSRIGSTTNPYGYTVPQAAANPVRALVFDTKAVTVSYRVDGGTTWNTMTRADATRPVWVGTWNTTGLSVGSHTLEVRAVGTNTRSHVITVSVAAGTANRAPVATDDSYTMNQGAVLNVSAPGVLANDSDPEKQPLTAVLLSGPAHGALTPRTPTARSPTRRRTITVATTASPTRPATARCSPPPRQRPRLPSTLRRLPPPPTPSQSRLLLTAGARRRCR